MPGPEDWPLVLAGPIVRRVEPRLASVWVALKAPRAVRLDIWQGIEGASTTRAPLATETSRTVRIGDNLHLVVATLQIPQNATPLLPGLIYSYNLTFINEANNVASNLRLENLLVDKPGKEEGGVLIEWPHLALGYATDLLPTFSLPPTQLDQLKIVHGSCRRAGANTPDALPWVDDLIRESRHDANRRPHQLVLSGDQIYADDVPDAFQNITTGVANDLMGTTEYVPTRWPLLPNQQGTRQWPVDLDHFPAGLRKNVIMADARFSTNDGESHLISLGEFLAMYLLSWSNILWPARMPDMRSVYSTPVELGPDMSIWSLHTGLGTDVGEDGVKNLCKKVGAEGGISDVFSANNVAAVMQCVCAAKRPGFRRAEKVIRNFRGELPKVRRALANVPTYMMFDDHEVTDDWYFSQAWRDQVLTSPLGRTIVRNGLLSYAVCQGWGNDPLRFMADVIDPQTNLPKPGPHKRLLQRLPELFPSGEDLPPISSVADELDTMLGLDGASDPALTWHYSVPGPRHLLVVLDVRTRRTFASRTSAPGNLSPKALAEQIPPGPLPAGIDVMVMVSSLTVIGTPVIDELIGPMLFRVFDLFGHGNKGGMPGTDPDAIEAWPYEPRALEALLKRLEPYRRVVVLSGDVHWGYSAAMSYWKKGETIPSRIAQFTSSGMRNLIRAEIRVASQHLSFMQHAVRAKIGIARVGYDTTRPDLLVLPPNTKPVPALRERLRRSPALLPTVGWPPGTVENAQRQPDWAWRMDLPLVDGRPDAERPESVRPESLVPGSPTTDVAPNREGYRRAAVRHVKQLADLNHARQLLFASNLGIVTFKRPTPTTLEAIQELMAVHPQSAVQTRGEVFTKHVIPLIVGPQERPRVGVPL